MRLIVKKKNKASTAQISTINPSLIRDLREHFPPIGKTIFSEGLFSFSNDCNYPSILSTLKHSRTKVSATKTKVALVVGPANFPSILDELRRHGVNVLLLIDIDFRVREHNLHMLRCMEKSDTPEDFIENYLIDNPIEGYRLPGIPSGFLSPLSYYCKATFLEMLKDGFFVTNMGKYHFLSSLERYLLCKSSAKKIVIEQVTLDLMNEELCLNLARVLQRNNAELAFCNFTNIHEYDKKKTLSSSLIALTHGSNQCYVMFSKREQEDRFPAELCRNMNDYFKSCLNEDYAKCKEQFLKKQAPQTVNFSLFTKQDKAFFRALAQGNHLMFKTIEKEKKKNSEKIHNDGKLIINS